MGQPIDRQPHTLAQFARRAGISEGRARAMFGETPSKLPRPNGHDADGRPYWWASTIDAWCARTGRAVSTDSLWLYRAPAASSPAVELQRGVVRFGRRDRAMYVIVWDTEDGHVIYLQPLGDQGGDHKDYLARYAAELIEPRWWADAVVVMPLELQLTSHLRWREPEAYVYQLVTDGEDVDELDTGGMFSGFRRWVQRNAPDLTGTSTPSATWVGQMDIAEIAAVLGRPVPLWINDTDTVTNAEQTLSYDRTFTCPDTCTAWPAVQARLEHALEHGLAADFPTAWAALAVDAAEGLQKVRTAHERQPDAGEGWYLVCRPARPAPSIELEQRLTGAKIVTDTELVGKELAELRAVEGDLDVDDPRGDVYAEAIELLRWQLKRAAKESGLIRDVSGDYVPVADDGYSSYSAPWGGPVVDAWRKTLTQVDLNAALRLRRVHRVLGEHRLDSVREVYRDQAGRYVLVAELSRDSFWSFAEWPVSLAQVSEWTDQTVLAGDDELGTTTTLLALTPTDDGQMRIDPVPLPPGSPRDAFGYGYGGGTPATTYRALLRVALGDSPVDTHTYRAVLSFPDHTSQLWTAISTTKGPLRLSWPQLKLWARADRKYVAELGDAR